MKIVLLQDEIYLPSFAGGTKANRCLMESLAGGGHQCLALTRALTRSPDGPNDLQQFRNEMASRQFSVHELQTDVFCYEHRGVQVQAINCPNDESRRSHISDQIRAFEPDCVLVADDKRRFMLPAAVKAAEGRVIPLLQTIMQLPFGPLSVDPCENQTALMRKSPAIIVISQYMQQYIRAHGQMESRVMRMPVYGAGPFPKLARADSGFVTMINPCQLKGVSIFLDLALAHPQVAFAAVPTWGADDRLLQELRSRSNVSLLEPADEIEDILKQTRILVVPSLWPETFGYVVPEAMLRGIPVLASDLGGLPEAKLGVDYLLPVTPAVRHEGKYDCPPQDAHCWSSALGELLTNPSLYESCSRRSRQAALEFVSEISSVPFETLIAETANF